MDADFAEIKMTPMRMTLYYTDYKIKYICLTSCSETSRKALADAPDFKIK